MVHFTVSLFVTRAIGYMLNNTLTPGQTVADFFFSPELRQDAPHKKVEESVTERGNSMWADGWYYIIKNAL